MRSVFISALFAATLFACASQSRAEVFHSKESALRLAFPGADAVEPQELFLSTEDVQQISKRARAKQESRLVTVYVGRKDGELLGYAYFDTHNVRTLPETILVVVEPDGELRAVHLMAFHEPPEYQPPLKWLGQFQDRKLDDGLALQREIDGIAGSTLTAGAITAAVRRILAVHELKIGASGGKKEAAVR
jgi:Na+-translocating ferredoxin:NAD+ oxidoreductase RnfG subunit